MADALLLTFWKANNFYEGWKWLCISLGIVRCVYSVDLQGMGYARMLYLWISLRSVVTGASATYLPIFEVCMKYMAHFVSGLSMMMSTSCCGTKKQKMNSGMACNGYHENRSVVTKEMCMYCFDVLYASLHNLEPPPTPNFPNES